MHPLATAFLNKVTAYSNPGLFFIDKALSYWLGLKLHRGFFTRGKNHTLFWVLLCRQQTGWEFDPLARFGVPSQADMCWYPLWTFLTWASELNPWHLNIKPYGDPKITDLVFSPVFFPHNLKIKVSAMKYFSLEMHQHACEHPPETLCRVVKAPPVKGILKTDYFPLRSCLPRLFSTQGGDAHFI